MKIRQFIGPSRKEAILLPPRECERRSGVSAGRRLEIIQGKDGEVNNDKKEDGGQINKGQTEEDNGSDVTAEQAEEKKSRKLRKLS